VQLLLERGADPTITDEHEDYRRMEDWKTPMMVATCEGHLEVCEAVMESDPLGHTPI
jgi:hypothetical protein